MSERKPRIYIHPDGVYISIGFDDTPDTLLCVHGGGEPSTPGCGDVERAREWASAINDLIKEKAPERLWAESLIQEERSRQDQLVEDRKIAWNCAEPGAGDGAKLTVLTEEVGEVARAILENDRSNLREELTQVAAVAQAWLESLYPGESET